jgi:hypothetical protein
LVTVAGLAETAYLAPAHLTGLEEVGKGKG